MWARWPIWVYGSLPYTIIGNTFKFHTKANFKGQPKGLKFGGGLGTGMAMRAWQGSFHVGMVSGSTRVGGEYVADTDS